jgi:hypothetical protein
MNAGSPYPRQLTPLEKDLALWVLPEGSAGYAPYREFIGRSMVIAQGRRGEGEIILGAPGDRPDLESPLPSVVSFGVAAADDDEVSVTVREILDGQMSVEIVGRRNDRVSPGARIERKWTYASWRPGLACPQCGARAREVGLGRPAAAGQPSVLAICAADRRLWVYDAAAAVCRPVPVTGFYNELMLLKKVRDPGTALVSSRLFERPGDFSDAELASAFAAYNRIRTKIDLPGAGAPERRPGRAGRLLGLIFRT